MDSLHTLYVDASDQGMRLDKLLVHYLPFLSRTRLASLIVEGHVKVVGSPKISGSLKVKEGQCIEVNIPPLVEAIPEPQAIPLEILYEDADIIVINKAAGMVVHPAPGHYTGTLVNALLSHCGDTLSGINGVKRPGIVHRLDKETSGLLVAAKNDKAHRHLANQLSDHTMYRIYHAIIWGKLFPPIGTLEGSIGRDTRNRQRMAIRQEGKFARTHYKILESFDQSVSLVECRLETGRTHQIRVHLTAKGHPLMGDSVYKKTTQPIPSELKAYLEDTWVKGRQALHAKELSFFHPRTQEKLHFSIPLPADMEGVLVHLRKGITAPSDPE